MNFKRKHIPDFNVENFSTKKPNLGNNATAINELGFFTRLPDEMLQMVLNNLETKDFYTVKKISTFFNQFINLEEIIKKEISTNPNKPNNEINSVFYRNAYYHFTKLLDFNKRVKGNLINLSDNELMSAHRAPLLSLVEKNCDLLILRWFEKCQEEILTNFNNPRYLIEIAVSIRHAVKYKNLEALSVLIEIINISNKYTLDEKKEHSLFNNIIRKVITLLLSDFKRTTTAFTEEQQENLKFLFKGFSSNQQQINIESWLILTQPFAQISQDQIDSHQSIPVSLTIEMFEILFKSNDKQNILPILKNNSIH